LKKGFSILYMILLMVLISSFLLMGMKFLKLSQRENVNAFFMQKAKLFLKNSIELSLLAISGYDRGKKLNCLQKIKIISKDKLFIADIYIKKYYLSKNSKALGYCENAKEIESDVSHGMVLLKVVVKNNPNNKKVKEQIEISETTLQKI